MNLEHQFFWIKRRGRIVKRVDFLSRTSIDVTANRLASYILKARPADGKEFSVKPISLETPSGLIDFISEPFK